MVHAVGDVDGDLVGFFVGRVVLLLSLPDLDPESALGVLGLVLEDLPFVSSFVFSSWLLPVGNGPAGRFVGRVVDLLPLEPGSGDSGSASEDLPPAVAITSGIETIESRCTCTSSSKRNPC